ncbi:hypothetical protein F511_34980 [Dorcoceras hygrometricum]|uniref:Uncharacterized protein n=1 Tax=Dorcoceras hygrometricum TaxID=472368 RepID=A0A2Z7DAS5_9LAMI|nr:hypothetical protein F511_34980 [Dorcoceras hygrometricum]
MSLFDLQDVCIAIGSLATLDLPMVVDLIGIYGLKGPYCTLTTTNWFLQALSVIPRGSWGDVARRFYHDPLGKSGIKIPEPQWFRRRRPSCAAAAHRAPPPPLFAEKSFPAKFDEDNPSAQISSGLLVQADEGIPSPVMDLIDDIYRRLPWSIFPLALQLVDVIFFLSFNQHLLSTSDQLLLLSSTTDQTSHCRMIPVLFPPKRSNEQDSPLRRIQLTVGPQPLRLRNHNFGLAHRIMVKSLATSLLDPLGITDSACKNQLIVVSVQYGSFNTYIPIRSTTIDSLGYPRMRASGESSTTKHRLLHASAPHPIPLPNDSKGVGKRVKVRRLSCRVSMEFRVVRTNQYNQDLGLIHSTNGNHLESPNEGSSIDHQITIHLHAQNITMFPTNETWYFTSQILVSSSGGLILILTAQSTMNEFRMHNSIGYPRMRASGESSTTKHRLLHASGSHPILPPNDPIYVDVSITVERCVDDVDFTVREEDATSFELVAAPRIDVAAGSSRGGSVLCCFGLASGCPAAGRCEGERRYRTLISLLGSLATMRRVVNYHSSWARQQQVELFDASGNPGFTAGRGFNPAGGAPGGG